MLSTSDAGLRDFETARLRLARGSVEGGDSLASAFHSTTELAADTIRVERCGIWLFIEERRAIRCYDLFERSSRKHSEGAVLRAQDFPAYFAALERMRVVQADEAALAPATKELEAAYLSPLGIGAMLDAPLFRNGKVVGVVCHEHVGPPRMWTTKEVDFVSSVSDTVALEMEAAALRDAEASLRAREAQLAELRKWEALGKLAAGVAHDFRNVLVSVMAHAAILIRDHRSPPERIVDAQAILNLAEQGAELAKELMSLGSDAPHVPSVIDVADAVVSSAAMLRSILRGNSSELKIETGRTHARVFMDRTDIRRILFNLVANSRDAMTSSGTVGDPGGRGLGGGERRRSRGVRRPGRSRLRSRHGRDDAGPRLRPVLQHEGRRSRHGPGPVDRSIDHRTRWGLRASRERAWRGDHRTRVRSADLSEP